MPRPHFLFYIWTLPCIKYKWNKCVMHTRIVLVPLNVTMFPSISLFRPIVSNIWMNKPQKPKIHIVLLSVVKNPSFPCIITFALIIVAEKGFEFLQKASMIQNDGSINVKPDEKWAFAEGVCSYLRADWRVNSVDEIHQLIKPSSVLLDPLLAEPLDDLSLLAFLFLGVFRHLFENPGYILGYVSVNTG